MPKVKSQKTKADSQKSKVESQRTKDRRDTLKVKS